MMLMSLVSPWRSRSPLQGRTAPFLSLYSLPHPPVPYRLKGKIEGAQSSLEQGNKHQLYAARTEIGLLVCLAHKRLMHPLARIWQTVDSTMSVYQDKFGQTRGTCVGASDGLQAGSTEEHVQVEKPIRFADVIGDELPVSPPSYYFVLISNRFQSHPATSRGTSTVAGTTRRCSRSSTLRCGQGADGCPKVMVEQNKAH